MHNNRSNTKWNSTKEFYLRRFSLYLSFIQSDGIWNSIFVTFT